MVHGSTVTTSVQPVSRQSPSTAPARRSATTSACAVGSASRTRSLRPTASSRPSGPKTTAPTGTSTAARRRPDLLLASARRRRSRAASTLRDVLSGWVRPSRSRRPSADRRGPRHHASRNSSSWSPKPIVSAISAMMSDGSIPSLVQSVSRWCAETPRSASRSASPTGSSARLRHRRGRRLTFGRREGVLHLGGRGVRVAEQQTPQSRLLGEGRIGPEDPQVLPLIEAQYRQSASSDSHQQQRHLSIRVDVAEPISDLFDIRRTAEV